MCWSGEARKNNDGPKAPKAKSKDAGKAANVKILKKPAHAGAVAKKPASAAAVQKKPAGARIFT